MAQASSAAAREPSMEEILASIRRIIEDSDNARRSGDELQDDADGHARLEPVADFSHDVEDMADKHDASSVDDGLEVEAFRSELAAPPAAEPVAHFNGVHVATNGSAREYEGQERQSEKRVAAEPVQPHTIEQHEDGQQREDGAGTRGAIISDFTGRQVAASFEELSEAFSASRKRSYDEIAEEIMRPMLQDWLDNNLPLLVERLVREEIERVARGGVR